MFDFSNEHIGRHIRFNSININTNSMDEQAIGAGRSKAKRDDLSASEVRGQLSYPEQKQQTQEIQLLKQQQRNRTVSSVTRRHLSAIEEGEGDGTVEDNNNKDNEKESGVSDLDADAARALEEGLLPDEYQPADLNGQACTELFAVIRGFHDDCDNVDLGGDESNVFEPDFGTAGGVGSSHYGVDDYVNEKR